MAKVLKEKMHDSLLSKSKSNPNPNILVTDPGGTSALMFLVTDPGEKNPLMFLVTAQPWRDESTSITH